MLGKKHYQPKLFNSFHLADRVPKDSFYRRLKRTIDFQFLYKLTESYYGKCGQKSIDPVVFFKICLVGYLENITSDRHLVEHCSLRLDILFFLDHDIDEELPWHSTISRTRQLFPDPVFQEVFNKIFTMCVDKGMVAGHTQAIDSAMIKANASMESLELKAPEQTLEEHLKKVRIMSQADRQVKTNKASESQQKITASKEQIRDLKTTQGKWSKDQDQHPGASSKHSKYTSNKTHYSPTDPDARVSVKPGKARKLNFFSQMAVDSAHHVITHIHADYADKADNQCLESIVHPLDARLQNNGLVWENFVADAGYSSGENLAFLEQKGLDSYIPPHGTYKGGPEGFTYHKDEDCWECPQGKKVTFRGIRYNRFLGGLRYPVAQANKYYHFGNFFSIFTSNKCSVRVIAKRTLRDFWEKHADCEEQLKSWYRETEKSEWNNINELKNEYPSASILKDNRIVYNIRSNNYRLIVKLNFEFQICWIRFIGTHAEYDKIDANNI